MSLGVCLGVLFHGDYKAETTLEAARRVGSISFSIGPSTWNVTGPVADIASFMRICPRKLAIAKGVKSEHRAARGSDFANFSNW
jgi:hypothetical protein